jgi:hypothetical protein
MPGSFLNGEEAIPEDAVVTAAARELPFQPLLALNPNQDPVEGMPSQHQQHVQVGKGAEDTDIRTQFPQSTGNSSVGQVTRQPVSSIRKELARIMFPPTMDGHSARVRARSSVLTKSMESPRCTH